MPFAICLPNAMSFYRWRLIRTRNPKKLPEGYLLTPQVSCITIFIHPWLLIKSCFNVCFWFLDVKISYATLLHFIDILVDCLWFSILVLSDTRVVKKMLMWYYTDIVFMTTFLFLWPDYLLHFTNQTTRDRASNQLTHIIRADFKEVRGIFQTWYKLLHDSDFREY